MLGARGWVQSRVWRSRGVVDKVVGARSSVKRAWSRVPSVQYQVTLLVADGAKEQGRRRGTAQQRWSGKGHSSRWEGEGEG